jgi:DNA-binding NarL/FixJ family response regulator
MKTPIVIIDDHILIADALAIMISAMKNYEVIETFKSGLQFQKNFLKIKPTPAIIIVDVKMPEIDGATLAQWITENYPDIKILALSMNDNDSDIIKMIQSGAHGYLLKSIQPNELENALINIEKHGFYYTPMVSKALANNARHINQAIVLNEKEKQLLEQLCTDLSYKEIASKLFLSTRTIETYSTQLMEKFSVKGRLGLVLYAHQHQLL